MEEMKDFFTARVREYDAHMLTEVEGCRAGYRILAELLPAGTGTLLDLGCGTGLELEEIFRRFPALRVTGIDLTPAMLDELRRKFSGRAVELVCASYFDCDLGEARFGAAVSFQTMHHFRPERKRGLYRRLCAALKPGGCYLEGDYMVDDPAEEEFYFQEYERFRKEQGLSPADFYHYDTPCTVAHQAALLREAGFSRVEPKFREENTVILAAWK